MTPREAILEVLSQATEPLHWTVIQDRALRAGLIDPFEIRDVRRVVLAELRALAAAGEVDRRGTGVYALRTGAADG